MSNPSGPAASSGPAAAAPQRMRFAAFGDSLMWGQGVARNDRFSVLTAQGIGALHRRDGRVVFDESRSGAQIKVRNGSDREDFVDTHPGLFHTPDEVRAFLTRDDDSPAKLLFGEVPASFPTITWQVEKGLSDALADDIEVALVCGGGNDIGFESILDSRENRGTFVDSFTGDIRQICFQDTLELLRKMRTRMPSAVILLFGYYSPFSYESSVGALRGYFKHELNSPVKWWLNARANEINIPLPSGMDVNEAVAEARVRSVWAQGLATYWLRRAVTEANQDAALRGPGIIFVPSGFYPGNSVFAPHSMVADDYTHPASDPMQSERQRRTPRFDALSDMRDFLFRVVMNNFKGAKALRERIDGPTSMKTALFNRRRERGRTPAEHLAGEIHRIQRALIASFVHPNTQGARQYANMAVARFKLHRDTLASLPPEHLSPPLLNNPGGAESLDHRLRRFNLRRSRFLRGDVGHEFIDAIRVTVTTDSRSDRNFPADVFLALVLKQMRQAAPPVRDQRHEQVALQLNMQYYRRVDLQEGDLDVTKFHPEFEPNRTDEFSVDVSGHIQSRRVLLRDVIGVQLVVGDWPDRGRTWMPTDFTLDINGIEVLSRNLRGTSLHPRGHIDLGYPAPIQETPPVFSSTVLQQREFPAG
jgi:hypothetical protein